MAMVQRSGSTTTHTLSIKQFLISYALGGEGGLDGAERANRSKLRAEIERHNERTMTVVSRAGIETITRCGICPRTNSAPCIGLRRLAVPFADHPAYQAAWHI